MSRRIENKILSFLHKFVLTNIALVLVEGRMKNQDGTDEMEIEGEENETMEVYSCGLVDILATYGAGKKLDAALRIFVMGEDRRGLSSVPPNIYADRMVRYMELHTA